jgi:membrane protease YdiL (CAAX protease family)
MLSEKPWKPDAALRLLIGLFACMSFGILATSVVAPADAPGGSAAKLLQFVVGSISVHVGGLIVVAFFLREHGVGWVAGFGLASPRRGRTLALAGLAAAISLPVAWFLGDLAARAMEQISLEPVSQQTVQALQASVDWNERIVFGTVIILIAPVVEELIFRGILYPIIKQQGFPRLALWGTSLLFALTHANAMTFVPLTFLAVVLVLLYEATDNLLAPILTHGLFNAANFVFLVNSSPPA